MKIIRFPFIFKRGSRVIGRWSPLPNPLLRGADSFALISCHGFLPAHNACRTRCATPSRIHDATRPASFSPRQMREACPECVRERELSPRRNRSNRRERERGKEWKKRKRRKREIFDWWSALYAEEKKKESLRPAQLRIRTSPSILITGHGRKEFVKILNVRAFFRADN